MLHFFLGKSEKLQYCFNVDTSAPLIFNEPSILKQLLADGFVSETLSKNPIHPEERDVVESYDLGVNSYILKPIDFQQFTEAVRTIGLYWLLLNEPSKV